MLSQIDFRTRLPQLLHYSRDSIPTHPDAVDSSQKVCGSLASVFSGPINLIRAGVLAPFAPFTSTEPENVTAQDECQGSGVESADG